jgi:putative hydrolase of the HAD superfamily
MINNVSAIIFDLGKVILNLDMEKSEYYFFEKFFGYKDNSNIAQSLFAILNDYETGVISTTQFLDRISEKAVINISHNDIIKEWNSMILDIPGKRIEMLKNLSKHFRLFMLSNTNELHVQCYENSLKDKAQFLNLFEKIYYSYKLGHKKPDKETFQIIIRENNLNPLFTLFVDDKKENIEAAQQLGLQTLHIKDNVDVSDILPEYLDNSQLFSKTCGMWKEYDIDGVKLRNAAWGINETI